jgi:hypothetical protein
MLDLSALLIALAAPIVVGVRVTVTWQLDRFNDRTIRPIPVAANLMGSVNDTHKIGSDFRSRNIFDRIDQKSLPESGGTWPEC